jgi:Asp-tRNA(Asn)/Glu-tRNA(Gln) amidotransferase A subunit family amidase
LKLILDIIRVNGKNYPFVYENIDQKINDQSSKRFWKVAFIKTHTWIEMPNYVKENINLFIKKLAKQKNIFIELVDLSSDMSKCHNVHSTIYNKTLSYYFQNEYRQTHKISKVMKNLILQGKNISNKQFISALNQQVKLASYMDSFFNKWDIIISPSTAGEAPLIGKTELSDPSLMWTLCWLPVINIPLFKSLNNLPFGIQITSKRYNDYILLKFLKFLINQNLIPDSNYPKLLF